jgi:hypothetical protein
MVVWTVGGSHSNQVAETTRAVVVLARGVRLGGEIGVGMEREQQHADNRKLRILEFFGTWSSTGCLDCVMACTAGSGGTCHHRSHSA